MLPSLDAPPGLCLPSSRVRLTAPSACTGEASRRLVAFFTSRLAAWQQRDRVRQEWSDSCRRDGLLFPTKARLETCVSSATFTGTDTQLYAQPVARKQQTSLLKAPVHRHTRAALWFPTRSPSSRRWLPRPAHHCRRPLRLLRTIVPAPRSRRQTTYAHQRGGMRAKLDCLCRQQHRQHRAAAFRRTPNACRLRP